MDRSRIYAHCSSLRGKRHIVMVQRVVPFDSIIRKRDDENYDIQVFKRCKEESLVSDYL